MRVLVVEDEVRLAAIMDGYLHEHGFTVDVAADGPAGLAALRSRCHDVCVLDVNLPHLDGLEVLKIARAEGLTLPVLFLTARDMVQDRVSGLNAGADDYLVKPFALAELVARIRALLRRNAPHQGSVLAWKTLALDPTTRQATQDGEPLVLTQKQFALLECLLLNQGQVVTRKMLLSSVWGYSFDPGTNVVEVQVTLLRKRMRNPEVIKTVRGVGYRLGE